MGRDRRQRRAVGMRVGGGGFVSPNGKASVAQSPPELRRRVADFALKDAAERSGVADAEVRENLLDALRARAQELLGLLDALQLNVLARRHLEYVGEAAMECSQA